MSLVKSLLLAKICFLVVVIVQPTCGLCQQESTSETFTMLPEFPGSNSNRNFGSFEPSVADKPSPADNLHHPDTNFPAAPQGSAYSGIQLPEIQLVDPNPSAPRFAAPSVRTAPQPMTRPLPLVDPMGSSNTPAQDNSRHQDRNFPAAPRGSAHSEIQLPEIQLVDPNPGAPRFAAPSVRTATQSMTKPLPLVDPMANSNTPAQDNFRHQDRNFPAAPQGSAYSGIQLPEIQLVAPNPGTHPRPAAPSLSTAPQPMTKPLPLVDPMANSNTEAQTPTQDNFHQDMNFPAAPQGSAYLGIDVPKLPLVNSNPQSLPSERPQSDFPAQLQMPVSPQQPATTDPDSISSIRSIWWKAAVSQPFATDHQTEMVTIDSLLYAALRNSQQIQFISKDPLIRETEIVVADAEFDPALFASSVYEDRVDPVGNDLTTLNAPFLLENTWSGEAGFRRKTRSGGQLEVFQQLGFQNSNSRFFNPQDQGTSTLGLNFNQPLLRGAGQVFNRSQILLAQTSTDLAWEEFSVALQDELLNVVDAYWELYFRRSVFLQTQRNVRRGEAILRKIEGRMGLDSLPSQVARARSEVQSRRTELANAFRDIRNAETEIRRLISDPDWLAKRSVEMLPAEMPVTETIQFPLKNVVYSAIENRPEIKATAQRARIAAIQNNILTNELLPELTLLFSSYVSALEGDSGIETAFQQQFSSTPGVSLGLEFEVPYRNRAARSRHLRSRLQVAQIYHEFQQTTQNVVSEAQVAYNRVISAVETLSTAELAVAAAREDLTQNRKRWENFALLEGDLTEGQTPTLVLDQLLSSQQRLTDAELTYSRAIRELKLSQIGLRRATGTLLTVNNVTLDKRIVNNQPILELGRSGTDQQQPFSMDPQAATPLDYPFNQQETFPPTEPHLIPQMQVPGIPSVQNDRTSAPIATSVLTPNPERSSAYSPYQNYIESNQSSFQGGQDAFPHQPNSALTQPPFIDVNQTSTRDADNVQSVVETLPQWNEQQAPSPPAAKQATRSYSDFYDGVSPQNGNSNFAPYPTRR